MKCMIILNGVDLSSKVQGQIVGYKGTKVFRESQEVESTLLVDDGNGGEKEETVKLPLLAGGLWTLRKSCRRQ